MWIETSRDGLVRLFDDDVLPPDDARECDESAYYLEFSDSGRAQVKQEVGEAYVAHYDDIEPVTK